MVVDRDKGDLVARETEQRTRYLSRTLWLRSLMGNVSARPEIDGLARRMAERFVAKGEALYRAGSAADYICFIVSGRIKQGSAGLSEFSSGDILGFVDALQDRPHRFDAMALVDSNVLLLSVEDWLDFLEDNFEFFREMMFSRVHDLPLSTFGLDGRPRLLSLTESQPSSGGRKTQSASFVDALLALHSCPLFTRASIQAIAQLARGAESVFSASASSDLRSHGPGLWLVVEGWVELVARKGAEELLRTVGPGDLLGSVVPLGRRLDELSVRSEEGAWLLFLPQELFFDVMEDHFDLARSAMSYLAAQVEARNQQAEEPWQPRSQLPSPRGLPDLGSSPLATERHAG